MKALARDSFVYFALWVSQIFIFTSRHNYTPRNFLNYLLMTLVIQFAQPEFMTFATSWTLVIPPIMANHLLINMEPSRFQNAQGSRVRTDTCQSIRQGDAVRLCTYSCKYEHYENVWPWSCKNIPVVHPAIALNKDLMYFALPAEQLFMLR
jgi:hypothetical protein